MLRAVIVWLLLSGVFLFLLAKLRATRQARDGLVDDSPQWLPRVLLALAAMLLATLALLAFVLIF